MRIIPAGTIGPSYKLQCIIYQVLTLTGYLRCRCRRFWSISA